MAKRSQPLPVPPRVDKVGAKVRTALRTWFRAHQRDLPWRRTKDAYAIWVSEVMLQQTQVDRVVPYFEKFVKRFATVEQLAKAPPDDVLSHWSGLGYYSRARNLHQAAKDVVARFQGVMPRDVEQLRSLPGFGRYTAGAVSSIAFDQPAPLVDGNVARVFARLFEIEGAQGDRPRDELMWAIAERLVTGDSPGDFNQSLMELGATVCTPANPSCSKCPVSKWCGALEHERVSELPAPKKPTPRKSLVLAVAFAQRADRVLLAKRVEGGLFGGLWEMPSVELSPTTANPKAALVTLLGKNAAVGDALGEIERTLTHRDLRLKVFAVELKSKTLAIPAGYTEIRWVNRSEANALGTSSATEAALAQVAGDQRALTF